MPVTARAARHWHLAGASPQRVRGNVLRAHVDSAAGTCPWRPIALARLHGTLPARGRAASLRFQGHAGCLARLCSTVPAALRGAVATRSRGAIPARVQGASPRLYSVSPLSISAAPQRDPTVAALSSHRNALPSRAVVTVGQRTAAQLRVRRSASTA